MTHQDTQAHQGTGHAWRWSVAGRRRGAAALLFCALSAGGPCAAQQIQPPDFGAGRTIQTFSGLGLPIENAGALTLAGVTYSDDTARFRYDDYSSSANSFGFSIATDDDLGFLQAALATPQKLVGGYVGGSRALVSFYGVSGLLVGTVTAGGDGAIGFAGYRSDADPIQRVVFQDVQANGRIVILDDFTTASAPAPPVPEASAALSLGVLLALGVGTVGLAKSSLRLRAQSAHRRRPDARHAQ